MHACGAGQLAWILPRNCRFHGRTRRAFPQSSLAKALHGESMLASEDQPPLVGIWPKAKNGGARRVAGVLPVIPRLLRGRRAIPGFVVGLRVSGGGLLRSCFLRRALGAAFLHAWICGSRLLSGNKYFSFRNAFLGEMAQTTTQH